MNALLTAPSRVQHPPSAPVRRVGLVDRLALRVGLALVVWGRRPVRARNERRVTLVELRELERLQHAHHSVRSSLGPLA